MRREVPARLALKQNQLQQRFPSDRPVQEMRDVEGVARKLSIEIAEMDIRRSEDIAPAFAAISGKAQALYVAADALFNTNRTRISALALDARLPTVHGYGVRTRLRP
jgi:ABC-type uncharacterized transport system substrate-binding protein